MRCHVPNGPYPSPSPAPGEGLGSAGLVACLRWASALGCDAKRRQPFQQNRGHLRDAFVVADFGDGGFDEAGEARAERWIASEACFDRVDIDADGEEATVEIRHRVGSLAFHADVDAVDC